MSRADGDANAQAVGWGGGHKPLYLAKSQRNVVVLLILNGKTIIIFRERVSLGSVRGIGESGKGLGLVETALRQGVSCKCDSVHESLQGVERVGK